MGRTEYIVNYVKKNICRFEIRLNKNKDSELIEHLNSQPSINGYLRQLIESDMKKGSI